MYLVIAYLAGPRSVWARKPHPREIIARRTSRWLLVAIQHGKTVLKVADSGRCGFVVMKGDEIVHHERAKDERCNPLEGETGCMRDLQ